MNDPVRETRCVNGAGFGIVDLEPEKIPFGNVPSRIPFRKDPNDEGKPSKNAFTSFRSRFPNAAR